VAKNDYLRQSSTDAYAGLEYRNYEERDRYDRLLRGRALRAEVGQDAVVGNLYADPPSWTQRYADLKHEFVIQALSGSDDAHFSRVWNLRKSGSEAQENSPVPATASLYYPKTSTVTRIYAVTASVGNPNFSPHLGLSYNAVSGTQVNTTAVGVNSGTQFDPWYVNISVPDRGELVDIKVWVEVLHVSSSTQTGHLSHLGGCVIGLISPNVNFKSSIPIANSPDNRTTINSFTYKDIGSMYPLWIGFTSKGIGALDGGFESRAVEGWSKDRHIRTIFHDGARTENPFRITPVRQLDGSTNVVNTGSLLAGSPNGQVLSGNDWPWISDARVQDGGNHGAAGSPPAGWLTGPGGVAAEN
jgi:hypothetical protein